MAILLCVRFFVWYSLVGGLTKSASYPLCTGNWKDLEYRNVAGDLATVKKIETCLRTELVKIWNNSSTSKPRKRRAVRAHDDDDGDDDDHAIDAEATPVHYKQPWYKRLPASNLPISSSDGHDASAVVVDESLRSKAKEKLKIFPVFNLVDAGSSHTNHPSYANIVADQVAREWMAGESSSSSSSVSGRFCIWLDASTEHTLKTGLVNAVRNVTFGKFSGDLAVMEVQKIGETLLEVLEGKGKLCPHRWIMIFANVPANQRFDKTFFSAKSNWQIPRCGRFIITSTRASVRVEALGEFGEKFLMRPPTMQCRDIGQDNRPRATRRGSW